MARNKDALKAVWAVLWRRDQPAAANVTRLSILVLGVTGVVTSITGYIGNFPLFGSLSLGGISIIVIELIWENGRRDQLLTDTDSLHGDVRQVLSLNTDMESLKVDVRRVLSLSQGDVAQVAFDRINSTLQSMLEGATEWFFRGGAGSWIRGEALPALAQTREREVGFSTVLLDPREFELCLKYAQYRRKSRQQASYPSDTELGLGIRDSILGLIFALGWYQTHYHLRASVALTRHYSPLRLDGSQMSLMLTVADLAQPALRADAGSWLYDSLLSDFRAHFDVGGRVTLPDPDEAIYPRERAALSAANVRTAMGQTRLQDGALLLESFPSLSEADYKHILREAFANSALNA